MDVIRSEAGFQRDAGGVQFSAERADRVGEYEVGGGQVTAKGRDGGARGTLSLTSHLVCCQ